MHNLFKTCSTLLLCMVLTVGIYQCTSLTFKGYSIDYSSTKSIRIENFENKTVEAQGDIGILFAQFLQDKFVEETRLYLTDDQGDLEITGAVIKYDPDEPINVESNDQAAQSRITISVKISFVNHKDPTQNLETSFSANQVYDNNVTFSSVRQQLEQDIFEDLATQILNKSISSW